MKSFVTGEIPPNSVYAGNPAKFIKELNEQEFITRESLFEESSTYLEDLLTIEKGMTNENSFLSWLKSLLWPKR